MKIIAFHLPQFHAIPENDLWWGKDFTEWTSTKKAKPLYKNHYQPKVPLNNNYYNMLEDEVMEWQMKLAEKYGIGGFCFYHYWFCGKKLLEKPIERLLNNHNANLPYCLAWANEPWTRAWNGKEGEKEILLPQDYGDEKDWIEHFNYLLQFFKDDRYIRINGKPVFLIYRSYNILKCNHMINTWNRLAKENNLNGLYMITMETGHEIDNRHMTFDASVEFEPMKTLKGWQDWINKTYYNLKILEKTENMPFFYKYFLNKISYDECYDIITKREHKGNKKVYLGAFQGWDNTARKGIYGYITEGGSPSKFQKYLSLQIQRSKKLNNELLFINAWNEWSEGTYLEPDKKYGFAYLHAIKNAIDENNII